MSYHPTQLGRRYMDDSVYRSAATSALGYSGIVEARAPRYYPILGSDERCRVGYFGEGLGDPYGPQSLSPNRRGIYDYSREGQLGINEHIRRCTTSLFADCIRKFTY